MNTKELIAKYEQEKQEILDYQNSDEWKIEGLLKQSKSVAALEWVHDFIEDLKQVDEPQKVKVPEFVDTWIQRQSEYCKWQQLEMFLCDYSRNSLPLDLYNFYDNDENNAREKIIEAILHGYEVEQEPQYYIEIPLPKKLNGCGRIGQSSDGALEVLFTKIDLLPNWKTKFTEEEIKVIDERYWPFSVPVEPAEVD